MEIGENHLVYIALARFVLHFKNGDWRLLGLECAQNAAGEEAHDWSRAPHGTQECVPPSATPSGEVSGPICKQKDVTPTVVHIGKGKKGHK